MFASLLKGFDSQEAGKCQINALFSVVIAEQVRKNVYRSILYLLKGRMNQRNENDERSGWISENLSVLDLCFCGLRVRAKDIASIAGRHYEYV